MNRRNFLRGIFVVSVSPKLIAEISVLQNKAILCGKFTDIDEAFFNAAFSGYVSGRVYKECYDVDILNKHFMDEVGKWAYDEIQFDL